MKDTQEDLRNLTLVIGILAVAYFVIRALDVF